MNFVDKYIEKRIEKVMQDHIGKIIMVQEEAANILQDLTNQIESLSEDLDNKEKEIKAISDNLKVITNGLRGVYQILQQVVNINTNF